MEKRGIDLAFCKQVNELNNLLCDEINNLERQGYIFSKIELFSITYTGYKDMETNEWLCLPDRLENVYEHAMKDGYSYHFLVHVNNKGEIDFPVLSKMKLGGD